MEKLVSNEEIENKAKELVQAIKDDDKYKEYINLRQKLKDNKDIMSKMQEVKRLQKEYVKGAYLDKEIETKLNCLLKELEQNSLYQEYLAKEKEINNILNDISEGLNIIFNKLLNESNN